VTTSWIGRVGIRAPHVQDSPRQDSEQEYKASKTRTQGLAPFVLDRPKSTAASGMPIELTVNFRTLFYAPFYATQTLGFHAREYVEINLINSPREGGRVGSPQRHDRSVMG